MLKKAAVTLMYLLAMLMVSDSWQLADARPVARSGQANNIAGSTFSLGTVPDALKGWVPWVLDDLPQVACPYKSGSDDTRYCSWPGLLELKAHAKGAQFSQEWQVFAESWINLPGDADHWPQEVSVDGKPVPVIGRQEMPVLKLKPGTHRITGHFSWNTMPESLQLPDDAGLLRLELSGRAVPQPVRDENNMLWLQRKIDVASDDQVQLRIFRKVVDGTPVTVETQLHLDISGKGREINIARILLPELIPQDLQSALPARLKPDGSLAVQARAGSWDIQLSARHPAAVKSLGLGKAVAADDSLQADEEVWVFEAQPSIRTTAIEGPASVDPQQTLLPSEWRQLPAYLMRADTGFHFKEIRRGDSDPAPDRLSLQRRLWLSFDGSVMSISDRINGDIKRSTRLTMGDTAQLGRVGIAGQDRVITRGNDKLAGVEVARGAINLDADSNIALHGHSLPALGWHQDFDKVKMELNLPAGWRLFHAGGVDSASGAWLSNWNLLDFFIVLVIALAAARLWGRKWGVLSLLTLVLLYQEADSPRYLWIVLFAFVAMARALPAGALQRWMRRGELASLLLLIVASLVFATSQVRSALYPVLENTMFNTSDGSDANTTVAERAAPPPDGSEDGNVIAPSSPAVIEEPKAMMQPAARPAPPPEAQAIGGRVSAKLSVNEEVRPPPPAKMDMLRRKGPGSSASFSNIDPNARVQTGPGLPDWRWQQYQLVFDGPVKQDQQLDLWLLPPWAVKLLVAVRLLLLLALLACVAGAFTETDDQGGTAGGHSGHSGQRWRRWLATGKTARASAAAMLMVTLTLTMTLSGLLLYSPAAQAQSPSNEQLEELKARLGRPADCLPHCGEITRMLVQISGKEVRLVLELDAAADTSLALPGDAKSWLPEEARLDGKTAFVQRGDFGTLSVLAPAGKHRLELSGALLQADTLQLPLPHKPRQVEVRADGWDVAGLSDEKGVADTLQLSRKIKSGQQPEKPILPNFLQVERRLVFDKDWQVFTTVSRRTPVGTPVLLAIPLLPGEVVTTAGMDVKAGKLEVNLGPQVKMVEWRSTLPQSAQLRLQASQQSDWIESWTVESSSIWHISSSGLPPAASEPDSGGGLQFYPWPGEVLTLTVERPQAIPGQTMTIDDSRLVVKPGARASDYQLYLKLRSSRGGDYSITLPEGAVLQSVSINQQVRPIRANGRQLVLPVTPGVQQIEVSWRLDAGMQTSFTTAPVNLQMNNVNHRLELHMPHDRWLLMASGPGIGPAILFWGKLIVMLIAAVLLGRYAGLPVATYQWLLLGLGLTQTGWWGAVFVIAWFYACQQRSQASHQDRKRWQFNAYQIGMVLLTLAMLSIMFAVVQAGLLGQPDMQVGGNASSAELLRWYVDRSTAELQTAWVLSLPVMVYRALMLAWALWLAWAMLGWLKNGWLAFNSGGLWKRGWLSFDWLTRWTQRKAEPVTQVEEKPENQ